jgi:antitoxin component of RelBE/YafQ-DinJ toxin-antitoxin module
MTKTTTSKVREYQEDGSYIDREMTEAEIAQARIDAEAALEAEAALATREAKKQEVLDKLGLTSEDVIALLA